jgi:nuclear receptor subfamily 5 group A protein 3
MRLEAIRPDRTRGGRSSYDGYSPSMQQTFDQLPAMSAPASLRRSSSVTAARVVTATTCGSVTPPSLPTSTSTVLPTSTTIPQLTELLMAEQLMEEEETAPRCCDGRLTDDDADPFASLLHLTDHCLYRIVRWARNRPDFANISTDDQILLLQNCWAELLCINACWQSVTYDTAPELVRIGRRHVITPSMAVEMGIDEVTRRLTDFTETLRVYEVDVYDLVAMKTLLLLSPDVKNLSDVAGIRAYQDGVLELFMQHSAEHYAHMPFKVTRLLARLAELSRVSAVAKELLAPHQSAGRVPHHSLLHELLKGDVEIH